MRFGASNPTRYDLARFRYIGLQEGDIFVIDLFDLFGGETAILTPA